MKRDADDERWTKVIEKLMSKTEQGKIEWSECGSSIRDNVIGIPYAADVENKHILIYEYQYKNYDDENDFYWASGVAVEFVDNQLNLAWRLPQTDNRRQLLEAVRRQASGADEFAENSCQSRAHCKCDPRSRLGARHR
ncbi:MAG: hypothetical protein QM756_24015 [Polyangiaceae bacterium]